MDKWQNDFEKWLHNNTNIADRTIREYSNSMKKIASYTNTDLSKIITEEEFINFYMKTYRNKNFTEKNMKSRLGVPVAHFHDYVFSALPNWPKTKWIGNIPISNEHEMYECAISEKKSLNNHHPSIHQTNLLTYSLTNLVAPI